MSIVEALEKKDWRFLLERYLPLLFLVIYLIIIVVHKLIVGYEIKVTLYSSDIYNSLITLSAIIIGFLATMISVFISVVGSQAIKRIQQSGDIALIRIYFAEALISGFILTILSIILLVLYSEQMSLDLIYHLIYFGIIVYFLLCTIRILWLSLNILSSALEEGAPSKKSEVYTPKLWRY